MGSLITHIFPNPTAYPYNVLRIPELLMGCLITLYPQLHGLSICRSTNSGVIAGLAG
jgi:hypothetical protein